VIEFTSDGPFAGKADPLFPDRVRIIGLGQTGAAVCDQVVLHGRPGQDLWVFDSDQQTIEASIVPNRHLLGRELVHGLGSSGDLTLAREIVALEENRLAHVARGCDFLILVLGLAGSTGLALAEYLNEEGHKAGAKVIVVGVQPFAFEGWSRREKAIEAIAQLRREADSVLVLSHDRLADNPSTSKNVRHGFHVMHQLMAQATQALAQVVSKRGLVQLSFADVRSLYGRYAGSEVLENCWAAHVEGDIHDRTEDLAEQLLASPLLGDESIWKHVDHAILTVSGTREVGLSDVQEIVGALKDRLPPNLPLATSASLEEEGHEKVRLTILLAMTAPATVTVLEEDVPEKKEPAPRKPVVTATTAIPHLKAKAAEAPAEPVVPVKKISVRPPTPAKAKPAPVLPPMTAEEETLLDVEPVAPPAPTAPVESSRARRFVARQEEMQFEVPTRGRFEKTHETIHNGENLDQPTFRRRRLTIRL
jgi:cell division protein FtsZ